MLDFRPRVLRLFPIFKKFLALSAFGLGALAMLNAWIRFRTPRLGPRLSGFFDRFPARFGDLAYVVAGSGTPVLLLHGLDAGRSMAEWRAIFGKLSQNHTVYALDFPGYGLSDSGPEGLNAESFAEQIATFGREIIGRDFAVIAAGAGAMLALQAAQTGAKISKIVLVCPLPAGFDAPSAQSRGEVLLAHALASRLLRTPVVGTATLNWWRSRAQLERRAHHQGFFDKSYAQNETNLWHTTAHQNGADLSQRAFLEGNFEFDWRQAWKKSEFPALVIWGRHATRGFDSAGEWLAQRPDARLEVMENAMELPHIECADEFLAISASFLENK